MIERSEDRLGTTRITVGPWPLFWLAVAASAGVSIGCSVAQHALRWVWP